MPVRRCRWNARCAAIIIVPVAVAMIAAARGPMGFGRIFARHHSATLAIRTDQGWRSGFFIGAHGEFLFGSPEPPSADIKVRLGTSKHLRTAKVLAHHAGYQVGIGRLPPPFPTPLHNIAPTSAIRRETWALVLSTDLNGQPVPYAGIFTQAPTQRRAWAQLMATAQRGSAVLNPSGQLVGIAIDTGARYTRVVPIDILRPFLDRAVREHPAP